MGEVIYFPKLKLFEAEEINEEINMPPEWKPYMAVSKMVWEYMCCKVMDLEKAIMDLEKANNELIIELEEIKKIGFWRRLLKWPYKTMKEQYIDEQEQEEDDQEYFYRQWEAEKEIESCQK